jgi:hypothetical protein
MHYQARTLQGANGLRAQQPMRIRDDADTIPALFHPSKLLQAPLENGYSKFFAIVGARVDGCYRKVFHKHERCWCLQARLLPVMSKGSSLYAADAISFSIHAGKRGIRQWQHEPILQSTRVCPRNSRVQPTQKTVSRLWTRCTPLKIRQIELRY